MLARRLVAIGGLVIILLAFALLLKSCADTARQNGLKDYNQQVNAIGRASGEDVTEALRQLSAADAVVIDQQQALAKLAADSAKQTNKARDLDVPGGLEAANVNLVTALGLRATALDRIGLRLPVAKGSTRAAAETATEHIAGQMSALLASDVLWQLRVTPFIKEAFEGESLGTQSVTPSVVLKDLGWLSAGTVANRIGGESPQEDTTAVVAPGTHGHGLEAVTANGTTLNAGSQPTTVAKGTSLAIVATVANQGENDEQKVKVTVTGISKATNKEVFSESKTLPTTKTGTSTPVTIPITPAPTGSVEITVQIAKVGGEANLGNNKQTYNVIFS